jgi:hypothetical protein
MSAPSVTAPVVPVVAQPPVVVTPVTIEPSASGPFTPYKNHIKWGQVITMIAMLIDPTWGAATGTYYITSVASNVALDKLFINWDLSTVEKVTKTVVAYFIAVAAGASVAVALGVEITMAPDLLTAYFIVGAALRIFDVFKNAAEVRTSP